MYKNVLLTERELLLLSQIVYKNLQDYPENEATNLTILLNQLKRSMDNKSTINS